MSAEGFQLIDNEKIDGSIIKRDFIKKSIRGQIWC